MKLYIWANEDGEYYGDANASRYDIGGVEKSELFGFHDGAIIVLSESEEGAIKLATDYWRGSEKVVGILRKIKPIEVGLKEGVVYSAMGEC